MITRDNEHKDNKKQIENYKKSVMYEGLLRLNDFLIKNNLPKISLNTVGGFAMIAHNLRDICLTDIDYVGSDFSKEIQEEIDNIGLELNLGYKWINNDVMLSGSSLSDFELSTGKLHFIKAFDLEKISVSILDIKDLLRMKVIAIDTSYASVQFGGDFTRVKDLPDIKRIMDSLKMDILDLEMETYMYNISDDAYKLIDEYLKNPDLNIIKKKTDKASKTAVLLENWEKEMAEIEDLLKDKNGDYF